MTLSEFLSGRPEELKIKIGTQYGAGFFFCGTANDLRRYNWGYSRKLKARLEMCFEQAKIRLARAERGAFDLPKTGLLIESGRAGVKRAKWNLDAFKPIADREVLETLTASEIADEDKPMIIYIEGTEDGTYWTMHEAESSGEPFSLGYRYTVARGGR